jgi:hypothetical protein
MSNLRPDLAPFLDARLEGMGQMTALAGQVGTWYYTVNLSAPIDKLYFNGLSFYAWDSNKGDYLTLWTEYYVPPLNQWKRYKKFAKDWMVMPNTEMKDLLFPTTPTNGVRVVVQYHNVGANDVDFICNLYNFVDQQAVSPSALEEGEDW